jgi:uncharacterized protein (DUF433 family)
MNLPEFLDRDADDVIRIRGHRLRLIDIASRYDEGMSAEGICEYYDAIRLPIVHKLIAFYLENEQEVRQLIAADRRVMDDLQSRIPKGPGSAELRRRLKARHEAGAR